MTHFLANEWDKSQAQKRGGGQRLISFDAATAGERYQLEPVEHTTPQTLFERRWAQTVLGTVLDRLAAETEARRFEVLKRFLLEDKGALSYDEAAEQLGLSVPAITSAIHRLRTRLSALLVEEVSHTVDTPEAVESELRYLLEVLSR
jgi:RNA polymerase sigma-70 factor (ECF subfamily)